MWSDLPVCPVKANSHLSYSYKPLCHLIQSSVSESGHIFSSQNNLKPSPAKLYEQCLPSSGITFSPQELWTERTTSTEKDWPERQCALCPCRHLRRDWIKFWETLSDLIDDHAFSKMVDDTLTPFQPELSYDPSGSTERQLKAKTVCSSDIVKRSSGCLSHLLYPVIWALLEGVLIATMRVLCVDQDPSSIPSARVIWCFMNYSNSAM